MSYAIGGIFDQGFPAVHLERLCETSWKGYDSGDGTNVCSGQGGPPPAPKEIEERVAFSNPDRNKIDFGCCIGELGCKWLGRTIGTADGCFTT